MSACIVVFVCSLFSMRLHQQYLSHSVLKQNHCPSLRTACPKTSPKRIALPAPAPLTQHRTTEQQRRSGHITLDTHTRRHRYGVSAPTRLNSAQCVHPDEWKVGLNMHTDVIVRDRSINRKFYATMK